LVFLLLVWMMAFLAFHIAGALIHFLLLVAVIALIVHLARGERRGFEQHNLTRSGTQPNGRLRSEPLA